MSILEIIGILGFIGYISTYTLLQAGVLDGAGLPYSALNMVSALLVLISLTETFNLASALIQISWIAISLWGMTRRLTTR